MELAVETIQGLPTIRVRGDIGLLEIQDFKRCLRQLAEAEHETVVIDGSEVSHIYSEGLGAMAELAAVLHQRGGRLIVRDPSSRLARLLNTTSLNQLLTVETSTEERS
jgi:anti-anti-sigma factor